MPKDTILQTLADQKQQQADYDVKQIGLFGSYLRDDATENSHIYLLIDMVRERKSLKNFLNLNYHFEKIYLERSLTWSP